MQTQAAVAEKVFTDLTCWKCGEESLKAFTEVVDSHAFKAEGAPGAGLSHSDCEKCGAYSVNPAQLRHNKTVARSNRKAIIKEANRKSGV